MSAAGGLWGQEIGSGNPFASPWWGGAGDLEKLLEELQCWRTSSAFVPR